MNRRIICTLMLSLLIGLQANANTWRVFKQKLVYANGIAKTSNPFVGDHGKIYGAYRLPNGETLVATGASSPAILAEGKDAIEMKYAKDFEAVGYTGSTNIGFETAGNGNIYMHTEEALFLFDVTNNKWTGFNVKTGKNTSQMPALDVAIFTGMTIGYDGSVVVAAVDKNKKLVIAQLAQTGWETLVVEDHIIKEIKESQKGASFSGFELVQGSDIFSDTPAFHSLTAHKDGSVWMMSGKGDKGRLIHLNRADMSIVDGVVPHFITADADGGIYMSTAKGIFHIDSTSDKMAPVNGDIAGVVLYDKIDNALWYSLADNSKAVMNKYSLGDKWTKAITKADSPVDPTVFGMSQDAAGNKSFISTNGICLLDMDKTYANWSRYTEFATSNEDRFKAGDGVINKNGITPTRYNTYSEASINGKTERYLGIYENGAWEYSPVKVAKEAKTFIISGTILSASCNTSKGILLGTTNDGLLIYDKKTQMATRVPGYDEKAFTKEVRSIVEDKNGIVWVATKKGLIKYDGTTFTLMDKKNSELVSSKINVLHITPNNVLWIGTGDKGLVAYNGTSWTYYGKKEGLKNQNVHIITGYGEKIYCFGVNFLRLSDELQVVEDSKISLEKLPLTVAVNCIDTDEKGNLWLISYYNTVGMRAADSDKTTLLDADSYPLAHGKFDMNSGYYFDGKLYVSTNQDPLSSAATGGFPNDPVSPEKQAAINYKDRIRTFISNTLYVYSIK